ncbi:MAG: beta-lactamase family protein, partial [Anaerolineaceae bacterium]|nr:beta-lactamase family protein [Anaerolineaceae bacterium]
MPVKPDTVFQIGSISKQFTAAAIALLARDGKLDLDDDIRKYLPEVPDLGETITIRHLIHHTSGLRDIWEVMLLSGYRMDDILVFPDFLEYIHRQQALNFKPGDRHLYCNTGYSLMAIITERVSEMSIREFCDRCMFKPLGMEKTLFHDDYKQIVNDFASSYAPGAKGEFAREVLSHAFPGSTSLLTTVEDMAKWDQELYEGRVLGVDIVEQMHELFVLNDGEKIKYAYGLVIDNYRGLKTVGHGGSDAGYRAEFMRFPEQQFSVVILGNLAGFTPDPLAKKIADLFNGDIDCRADDVEGRAFELLRDKLPEVRFKGFDSA